MKFRILVASALVLAVVTLAVTVVIKGQKVTYEGDMVRDLTRSKR